MKLLIEEREIISVFKALRVSFFWKLQTMDVMIMVWLFAHPYANTNDLYVLVYGGKSSKENALGRIKVTEAVERLVSFRYLDRNKVGNELIHILTAKGIAKVRDFKSRIWVEYTDLLPEQRWSSETNPEKIIKVQDGSD